MPFQSLPTSRDLHPVSELLTDYAVAYGQQMTDFVADQASTMKRVEKDADRFFIWDKADIYRSEMKERADGDEAAVAGLRLSTDTYFAEVYALKTYLTDRQKQNSDTDAEKAKIRYLVGQAKLRRDLLWAAELNITGVWTANTEQTGVAAGPAANQFVQWDVAGSTPIKDIQDEMQNVRTSTGKTPNVAVTSPFVMNELQRHADILDLYKHTQPGIPTEDLVASALGLDRIVVGRSVQNTGIENAAATMADVWAKNFLLLHIPPGGPSDDDASAVTGFAWNEFDKVDANGASIRSWFDQDRKATAYEAEMAVDFKATALDLGVMLLTAVG